MTLLFSRGRCSLWRQMREIQLCNTLTAETIRHTDVLLVQTTHKKNHRDHFPVHPSPSSFSLGFRDRHLSMWVLARQVRGWRRNGERAGALHHHHWETLTRRKPESHGSGCGRCSGEYVNQPQDHLFSQKCSCAFLLPLFWALLGKPENIFPRESLIEAVASNWNELFLLSVLLIFCPFCACLGSSTLLQLTRTKCRWWQVMCMEPAPTLTSSSPFMGIRGTPGRGNWESQRQTATSLNGDQ